MDISISSFYRYLFRMGRCPPYKEGNCQSSGKETSGRHHTQVWFAYPAWVCQWTSLHLSGNSISSTGSEAQLEITLYIQTPVLRASREDESNPEGGLDQINH